MAAEHLDYRHTDHLPATEFHRQLTGADLFVTGNAVSVSLTEAVLAGVPSLLLQNHKVLDLAGLRSGGSLPAWLAAAAPELFVAYPFRVWPWGWYEFLAPVLADNPYVDCFLTAGVFEHQRVLAAMTTLLDDADVRTSLLHRQSELHTQLNLLPCGGRAARVGVRVTSPAKASPAQAAALAHRLAAQLREYAGWQAFLPPELNGVGDVGFKTVVGASLAGLRKDVAALTRGLRDWTDGDPAAEARIRADVRAYRSTLEG